jgi:hypothetical protein
VEKKIDWTKFPQKQDTTPLTEKKIHEVTKPWNKEKEWEKK